MLCQDWQTSKRHSSAYAYPLCHVLNICYIYFSKMSFRSLPTIVLFLSTIVNAHISSSAAKTCVRRSEILYISGTSTSVICPTPVTTTVSTCPTGTTDTATALSSLQPAANNSGTATSQVITQGGVLQPASGGSYTYVLLSVLREDLTNATMQPNQLWINHRQQEILQAPVCLHSNELCAVAVLCRGS